MALCPTRRGSALLTWPPLFLFLLLLAPLRQADALPMYAAEYGASCATCHHNPGGGGIRNYYGAEFISRLDLPSDPVAYPELSDDHMKLHESLQVGVDFRSFYVHRQPGGGGDPASSFVTMQGDLYLAWFASRDVVLLLDKGLRNSFEASLLLRRGEGSFVLRTGRMVAGYGWRLADHRAYVRRFTGFGGAGGPGGFEDGAELGWFGGRGELSVSVTNGLAAGVVDGDAAKAATVRGAFHSKFAGGALRASLGASWRYGGLGAGADPGRRLAGLFGYLSYGPLSWVGEGDVIVDPDRWGYAATHQLRWRLFPGLELRPGYGFHEPDWELKSGVYHRAYASFAWIPRGYLSLIPTLEWESTPDGEFYSALLQLRFWM